jgi:hypothetical protein
LIDSLRFASCWTHRMRIWRKTSFWAGFRVSMSPCLHGQTNTLVLGTCLCAESLGHLEMNIIQLWHFRDPILVGARGRQRWACTRQGTKGVWWAR